MIPQQLQQQQTFFQNGVMSNHPQQLVNPNITLMNNNNQFVPESFANNANNGTKSNSNNSGLISASSFNNHTNNNNHNNINRSNNSNNNTSITDNSPSPIPSYGNPLSSSYVTLENGLILDRSTSTIITSSVLKNQFNTATSYFGDFNISLKIVKELNLLLGIVDNSLDECSPRSSIAPIGNNNDTTTPPKSNDSTTTTTPTNSTSKIEKASSSSSSSTTPDADDVDLKITQKRVDDLLNYLILQNEDLQSTTHRTAKNYSLILNKNGKLDIISLPKSSNLQLSPKDLIIIDGDRGKDLVMVLKPVIDFRFALLFNYLKKKLHLKSLEFGNSSGSNPNNNHNHNHNNNRNGHHNNNNNHNNNMQKQSIINEDENFITLPNKQVLSFAKPQELTQLTNKYNDELMALKICLNYVSSLNLDLIIKNVEFQFDKKKLIIYYYCLRRLDFRGFIKELFKIYKTRIWLCAVLPLEKSYKPLLNYEIEKNKITSENEISNSSNSTNNNSILLMKALSNENISDLVITDSLPVQDNINTLTEITEPIYFHSKIFLSLIDWFKYEISNKESFEKNFKFINRG